MRVFKPTRKGPRGAAVPYARWYVEFRDHREIVRRLRGFTDRGATEELGRKVERLAEVRGAGGGPDRELARFVEDLPARTRETLARWGVLELRALAASTSLSGLLVRFEASLAAAGCTAKHVRHVAGRARRAFAACRFKALTELDAHRLSQHPHERRREGLSAKTSNHLLASCREFTCWAVTSGLLPEDPLRTLRPMNARTDPRRERRALSFTDELPRLLRAASEGPEYRGVSGQLRALVWRLAAESGLRVAEITGLRAGDFDLEDTGPSVTVRAAAARNRRERTLPLRPTLAHDLRARLRGRMPTAAAFPLPRSFMDKATRWLRFDLEAAGLPYVDESGRVADVHSLREIRLGPHAERSESEDRADPHAPRERGNDPRGLREARP